MMYKESQIDEVTEMVVDGARRRRAPNHATLITFSGDLGAGKTTLIASIAKNLGITETLHSPTFVIYKRYELPLSLQERGLGGEVWKNLVHGDMYRLESADEIEKLGWQRLLNDPENIICIEWPEKITSAVPDWAMQVTIEHVDNNQRNITIQ